jgi:hypothetical protein
MPIKYGFVLNAAILASSGLNASKMGAAAAVAAAILIYYRDNFKIKKLGSFFILKFYHSTVVGRALSSITAGGDADIKSRRLPRFDKVSNVHKIEEHGKRD